MLSPHQICYEIHGNPKYPCIVLITGIGGQLLDWPKVMINTLMDEGLCVITFDNRDSGLSRSYDELMLVDHPTHPPYTLEELANDVIVLMDDLHIKKSHILGRSMGGIIAQYVAINFPERVLSLICLATTSGDPTLPKPQQDVMAYFSNSMNATNSSLDEMLKNKLQLFKIYSHPDTYDEEAIKAKIIRNGQRANNPNGFKRLMLAMAFQESRSEKLKSLNCPCLIIHGDYDPVFSLEHGKQLASCISNSDLKIIHNMGHIIPDSMWVNIMSLIVTFLNKIS